MTIRQMFPESFNNNDFLSMPARGDQIAEWFLRAKPRNFPFFGANCIYRREDDKEIQLDMHGIQRGLMKFEHNDIRPFYQIAETMEVLRLVTGSPDIAAPEAGLLFFYDGINAESLSETREPVSKDLLFVENILANPARTLTWKTVNLRSYIARKAGMGKSGKILSAGYLNFLSDFVLPHFFTCNSKMDEFEKTVYPSIVRMFALLTMTGKFVVRNDSYTLSFADGEDFAGYFQKMGEKFWPHQKWKIRISMPSDYMVNADLMGYFGIFTKKLRFKKDEKPWLQQSWRELLEAMRYANISDDPSKHGLPEEMDGKPCRYAADPELLIEICCALFCHSMDNPLHSGGNCVYSDQGMPCKHAPAHYPDAFAVYADGTTLTLEPSLNENKDQDEWMRNIKSAVEHVSRGDMKRGCADVIAPKDGEKFSFLMVRELPKNRKITETLLEIAATPNSPCVIPMSFSLIQGLVRYAGAKPLGSISHHAVREFLGEVKKCMANVHARLEEDKNAAEDGKAVAAEKDGGDASEMNKLLKYAKKGELTELMSSIVTSRMHILLKGMAPNSGPAGGNTPKPEGGNTRQR